MPAGNERRRIGTLPARWRAVIVDNCCLLHNHRGLDAAVRPNSFHAMAPRQSVEESLRQVLLIDRFYGQLGDCRKHVVDWYELRRVYITSHS